MVISYQATFTHIQGHSTVGNMQSMCVNMQVYVYIIEGWDHAAL